MSGTIEISEVGMTVNMAGGGKIVIGNWGDGPVNTAAARPPLTPEEELYGRGLCLLPDGWEDLSGDGHGNINSLNLCVNFGRRSAGNRRWLSLTPSANCQMS